jgi:hypothetical protein
MFAGCDDPDDLYSSQYVFLRFHIVDCDGKDLYGRQNDVVIRAMDGVQIPVVATPDYFAFRTAPPQEKYSLEYGGRSTTLSTYFYHYGGSDPHIYLSAVYTSLHGKCKVESDNLHNVFQIQL